MRWASEGRGLGDEKGGHKSAGRRGSQGFISLLRTDLDSGEAEAIALAREIKADWLRIDEKRGRQIARLQGLPALGLGGVLLKAKERKLITTIAVPIGRTEKEAGFYLGRAVKLELLRHAGESE
jgi:hypothetical protein